MKRCKILIVDDIPTNVTLISTIIKKKLDAYSDTALSGEEALKKIESFNPNIIILDLMMPGVDGWDVIRSVRSKHGKDEVAIIVTSAITDEVNMAECYDLGVTTTSKSLSCRTSCSTRFAGKRKKSWDSPS